ncbi:hypothetical protein H4Q26_010776 [Puccinia striiformis f. sp. tritici PST-130]|uniref:Uncharacterized protein n=1 Tax=Puccinia striiformis f. sp. tritici PST-78 TaxID=1165861 RepID=A0A0L0W475_9BASI|nr:hypothetical protein Pst134EB_027208 [Puccinia striiformis f. sp. tritici]KAI9616385.1 hypothetical protein H4Q26_010776 [Puccinia striiformis f. sp. tritici PST-130]KNF06299.1 hypothetical protein PSTG_00805 [Puccinia striiformis f. sp. tritici PST-78]
MSDSAAFIPVREIMRPATHLEIDNPPTLSQIAQHWDYYYFVLKQATERGTRNQGQGVAVDGMTLAMGAVSCLQVTSAYIEAHHPSQGLEAALQAMEERLNARMDALEKRVDQQMERIEKDIVRFQDQNSRVTQILISQAENAINLPESKPQPEPEPEV